MQFVEGVDRDIAPAAEIRLACADRLAGGCLRRGFRTLAALGDLADGGDAESCGSRRSAVLSPEDPAAELAATRPDFHPLDMSDGICDAERCPAIVGNITVYKDPHHLSATYVRSLTDELGRQMEAQLPWAGPAVP